MKSDVFGAKETVRQAKVVAVAKLASAVVNLSAQIAIARFLGIEDYATFTLFVAASSLAVLLTMYGIDRVCYRVIPPLRVLSKWREIGVVISVSLVARLCMIGALIGLLFLLPNGWLPEPLVRQLGTAFAPMASYILAMSMTDSLGVFCNGVGKQAAQSKSLLTTGLLRSAIVIFVLLTFQSSTLSKILWTFVAAEVILALILVGILLTDLMRQRSVTSRADFNIGFRTRDILIEGGTTQLSYVLRIPFGGAFLRLLVGSFAPPLITAAYGFFQTLSDRIYQFLPPILFKGVMEPALAADYAAHKDLDRIAKVISVLLKMSLVLVMAMVAGLAGAGKPLVDLITAGKYGSEILIATMVCIQLMSQVVGEVLWIALNPVGRVVALNKVWYGATFFAGLGLLVAYKVQSIWLLIAVAPLPYFAVLMWLRWIGREPMLITGIGIGSGYRLLLPTLCAGLVGHMVQTLFGNSHWGLALAGTSTMVVFAGVLMKLHLFTHEELEMTKHFSPLLSKVIKPLSPH